MILHDDETDDNREDVEDSPDAAGDGPTVGIAQALRTMPLLDEPYLHMQAMNLDIVDRFLIDQEAQLLQEYFELERTPFPSTMFVSALSQLWLFGLYELLRTWRQRARDVLRWSKEFHASPAREREGRLAAKRREIERRAADPRGAGVFHWRSYERAADDPTFGEILRKALDRTERLFRRIEAFRVALAKHEMPGAKGSFAMAPGYGRIDMTDGSISWQVVLQGNEVDLVSRRTIADQCKRFRNSGDTILNSCLGTKYESASRCLFPRISRREGDADGAGAGPTPRPRLGRLTRRGPPHATCGYFHIFGIPKM